MNSKIFCFSGTGNSLNVAIRVDEQLDNNEIIAIKEDINMDNIDNVDKIGFVFPVYAYGMPRAVEDFIKRNKFPKNAYYFAIATCGGTPGNTIKSLDKLLKEKECKLSAGFTVKENNYNLMEVNVFMKFMILIGGKQPESFKTKKEEIINFIKGRKENKFDSSSWLANIIGDILHNTALDQLRNNVNNFYVNSNCIGCGTCVNICPKDNIEIKSGKPVWYKDCESCFGCFQWCKEKAIEFKGYEGNKKRSYNENISLKSMSYYLGKNKGIDQNG